MVRRGEHHCCSKSNATKWRPLTAKLASRSHCAAGCVCVTTAAASPEPKRSPRRRKSQRRRQSLRPRPSPSPSPSRSPNRGQRRRWLGALGRLRARLFRRLLCSVQPCSHRSRPLEKRIWSTSAPACGPSGLTKFLRSLRCRRDLTRAGLTRAARFRRCGRRCGRCTERARKWKARTALARRPRQALSSNASKVGPGRKSRNSEAKSCLQSAGPGNLASAASARELCGCAATTRRHGHRDARQQADLPQSAPRGRRDHCRAIYLASC